MSFTNNNTGSYYQNQGYNMGFAGGMQYQQPQQKPRMTQTLTKEQLDLLRKGTETFSLTVTEKDKAFAQCMHHDAAKSEFTTNQTDVPGQLVCDQCFALIRPDDVTEESVNRIVDEMLNVLQTIKLMAVDMPVEVAREYFMIIPYLQKVPQLYRMYAAKFNNYTASQNPLQNANDGINHMAMLNQALYSPGFSPFGVPNGMMGTPVQNQQAMMMGGNPFYQPQPMTGMNNMNVQMPQPQPMQQPAQPAGNNNATVTKTLQL